MSDAEIAAILTAPPPAPPTTPAEASSRLNQAQADTEWTKAFLGGNPARIREFNDWHELAAKGDNVDLAMAGLYQPGGMNSSDHLESHAEDELLGTVDRTEAIEDGIPWIPPESATPEGTDEAGFPPRDAKLDSF